MVRAYPPAHTLPLSAQRSTRGARSYRGPASIKKRLPPRSSVSTEGPGGASGSSGSGLPRGPLMSVYHSRPSAQETASSRQLEIDTVTNWRSPESNTVLSI